MTGKTSDNHRLDPTKALQIIADIGPDSRQVIELEGRLQALIGKLLAMRGEIEDPHTCQLVLHLGRRGDVKADVWKKGY